MPPNPRSNNPEAALKLSLLGGSLLGAPQSGLPDRTFIRGQGCWNCINAKPAVDRWFDQRFVKLNHAKRLVDQGQDENNPYIMRIRRHVEQMDAMVAQQQVFVCDVGRTQTSNGTQPVGDFVASAFLCDRWSGRDGASLARASDGKLDLLPEELRDKIDGADPLTPTELNNKINTLEDFDDDEDEDEDEIVIEKTPGPL